MKSGCVMLKSQEDTVIDSSVKMPFNGDNKKKSNDFKHKQKWSDFAFISWKKKEQELLRSLTIF